MIDRKVLIQELIDRRDNAYSFMSKETEGYGTEIPNTTMLRHLASFAKELGAKTEDYELLGVGQSLQDKADMLDGAYEI